MLSKSKYFNIDCSISIKDRLFLKRLILTFKTKKYKLFITLRDIEINRYSINEWIIVLFYIKNLILEEKSVIIKYTRDIYIVDNLKINLFIEINILELKEAIINLFKEKIVFIKCENVTILI